MGACLKREPESGRQRKERLEMIQFVNTFLSYFVLLAVIAAVGAVGIALGIFLRKKKDAKENH